MPAPEIPVATIAAEVAPRVRPSIYPEPYASRVAGRQKRVLGDLFGLKNFGVNLTPLAPGMCAGFRFGTGNAHHLVNETVDGKHRWTHRDGKPY